MTAATVASPPFHVIVVHVEESLRDHLDAATARLGYIHPSLSFRRVVDGIKVAGVDVEQAAIRREVLHAVYRERILERTLPLRRTLIDGLLRS